MAFINTINGDLVFTLSNDDIASIVCSRVNTGLDATGSLSDTLAQQAKLWGDSNQNIATTCCCTINTAYIIVPGVVHPSMPDPWDGELPPPEIPSGGFSYESEVNEEGVVIPIGPVVPGGGIWGGVTGTSGVVNDNDAPDVTAIIGYGGTVYIPIKSVGVNVDSLIDVSPPAYGETITMTEDGFTHRAPSSGPTSVAGTYSVLFDDGDIGVGRYFITYTYEEEVVVSTPCSSTVLISGTNDHNVYEVLVTDFDVNAGTIREITSSTTNNGAWTINASGTIMTYIPQVTGSACTDSCTFIVDHIGTTIEPCLQTINVSLSVAASLYATDDTYTIDQDTTLTLSGLLSNDSSNALMDGIITDPVHGTIMMLSNGIYTYMPDSGYVGTDSFVYRVIDNAGNTDTATVTVTVASTDSGTSTGGGTATTSCPYTGYTTLDIYTWDVYPNTSFVFDVSGTPGYAGIASLIPVNTLHGQAVLFADEPGIVRYYPDQPIIEPLQDNWVVNINLTDGSVCSISMQANLYNTAGTNSQY